MSVLLADSERVMVTRETLPPAVSAYVVFALIIIIWCDFPKDCHFQKPLAAPPSVPSTKILILQFLSNNEEIVNRTVTELRDASYKLGRQNVMIGFVESHSNDSTRQLLTEFHARLVTDGILCELVKIDEMKWPKAMYYSDRITFLAAIRNHGLELIYTAAKLLGSLDKVVCSNVTSSMDGSYKLAHRCRCSSMMCCFMQLSLSP